MNRKTAEHKNDGDTYLNWWCWYSHQRIDTGNGGLGNKRTSGDRSNYSIIKIGENTEESPGDLRRHAVAQTPVRKPPANAGVKNSLRSTIIIMEHPIQARRIGQVLIKKKRGC